MEVDSNILKLLELKSKDVFASPTGSNGMSSATTSMLTANLPSGSQRKYFVKMGHGEEAEIMFKGEDASLNSLRTMVPSLCPGSYGYGKLADNPNKYFLVTDFLDFTSSRNSAAGAGTGMSLAKKMAQLHLSPAPKPPDHNRAMFGFYVPTCCGDTCQPNDYKESWAEFYAENRLRFILEACTKRYGTDQQLSDLVNTTINEVVPRLIGDGHLNYGRGIEPVVVHGDLWSGNAGRGKIGGVGAPEDVVFDPSACYGHAEYDLGIMKMFGGFGPGFLDEYHRYCPKTHPQDEFEDRVLLYELYHHLNHHALFPGGYRAGAISIAEDLVRKYGNWTDGGGEQP